MTNPQTPELEARLIARAAAAFPECDWTRPSVFPLPAYHGDTTPAWIVWETRHPSILGTRAALMFDEVAGIQLIQITASKPTA